MTLIPKNWATFQHYSDRSPKWIKLHRALLDDYRFFCLPVASRALAPCLWLLASEYTDGKITAPPAEIAFRMHMSEGDLLMSLKPLIDSGFFVDASGLLAQRYQDAIPEERRDTRIDREEGATHLHQRKAVDAVGDAWPTDYQHQFWQQYPLKVGKKAALKSLDHVRKRGEVPFPDLMAALLRYASKTDDRSFCHPTTWINQGRWTDEPASNAHGRVQKLNPLMEAANRLVEESDRRLAEFEAREFGNANGPIVDVAVPKR